MREWTRDERYRVLQSPEDIRELHERIQTSVYRQKYHIQPVTGLSSDPNGFSLHKGVWHLCYQWCPWGAVHGLKYWYHVSSKDLIHWKNEGIGLKPDCYYDNRGVHSGSAISSGEDLYFFYTGNHRDDDWTRTPYTCAAVLAEDGKVKKVPEPLFGMRPEYTEHQRDPKIVWSADKQRYYILLGAQNPELQGRVLIYSSRELLSGWQFEGELKVPGYEAFGGMWECPYIVRIGEKDVLIFSPQYTTLPGRGPSTNHNVYFIGSMDYDTLTFTPDGPYHYLDYGFDFYAAQGAANVQEIDPNKAILIAWIGLPDNHYPTEEEDWEGSMTLPRELTICGGKLIQNPVSGIDQLRECEISAEVSDGVSTVKELPDAGEVLLTWKDAPADQELVLFAKEDGTGGLRIQYNAAEKKCTVDRSGMDLRFNIPVGEVLEMPLESDLHTMRIFIDRSSVEIFVNDGEETFTTHLYPTKQEKAGCFGSADVKIWKYSASVKDDFAV